MTPGDLTLRASGLRVVRGARPLLQGVDLDVRSGEVVGLLGPNGAGKTTTFGVLAGLVIPDAGSVRLGDQALDGLPLRERVRRGLGYLGQGPSVFRRLTAEENVAMALEAQGRDTGGARAALEALGVGALAGQAAGTLSGGERRRVEIARALCLEPRVLLLDEPFAGVDPRAIEGLQAILRDLARRGLAVLLTDHAVAATLRTCDRAVILDRGRVIAHGTPADVAQDPVVRERYLGTGAGM